MNMYTLNKHIQINLGRKRREREKKCKHKLQTENPR